MAMAVKIVLDDGRERFFRGRLALIARQLFERAARIEEVTSGDIKFEWVHDRVTPCLTERGNAERDRE
jgi:hypothetical protein